MEIIKWLMENYELDGDYDIDELWEPIKAKFKREDFVELANILVLLDNVPQALLDKMWEQMGS